jgi:small subunit ribosomal protein S21
MPRPVNVEVIRRGDEPIERMLKRFIKKCKKEKIIEEYKARRYYVKPSEKRRIKKRRRAKIARELQAEREKQTN